MARGKTSRASMGQRGHLTERRRRSAQPSARRRGDQTITDWLICEGRFPSVIAALSRRIHEKGYLAQVLPAPLAPLLEHVDASGLFVRIGGLPIENQPGARPLRSVATELYRLCGDLPLHVAFRSSAVDAVGPGPASLQVLIGPAFRAAGRRPFRIADIREPYRSRLLRAARATFDADVARISAAVERGAVFVVAPEGGYSSDGRMQRLRRHPTETHPARGGLAGRDRLRSLPRAAALDAVEPLPRGAARPRRAVGRSPSRHG